jgi:acyl-coenzyme A synthetase/AMP-(fatty) acid ligase
VSVLQLPTAYWREMIHAQSVRRADPAALPDLRTVVIGGEAAFWEDVHVHREGGLRDAMLINSYGPTEAGITSTAFTVRQGGPPSGALPLGTALGHRELLLTDPTGDANLQQIVIKGPEVADGYFRLEDMNLVPFPSTGDRVFHTGDLVTLDPAGRITFAGRQDRQVKVRGSRISLDAVEAALLELGATAAAAFVTSNRHGNPRIEVAVSGLSPHRPLKQELAALGPAVPVRYHHLPQLPKRSSGKIDHQAVAELCRNPGADEVPTLR